MMKLLKVEKDDYGRTVLTTSTDRFLRKPKIQSFLASRNIVADYWEWVELPNQNMVTTNLGLQLDTFLRLYNWEKQSHKERK